MVAGYILFALVVAASFYAALAAFLTLRFFRRRPDPAPGTSHAAAGFPPVSVLVPVRGLDDALEESVRTFVEGQDYPAPLEVILGCLEAADPALPTLRRLAGERAGGRVKVALGDGRLLGPNAKVSNLAQMLEHARHDVVVMVDADMRAPRSFLRALVAPLLEPGVGLTTSLYRGSGGRGLGGVLEEIAIDADFTPSVIVAAAMAPVRFALGAATAVRKETLAAIGGLGALAHYLGEDYHLGRLVAELGLAVRLAPATVLETAIGRMGLRAHLAHQLRWARTIRSQRPLGYFGSVMMNGLPFAAALAALAPAWPLAWIALGATLALRAAAAFATAVRLGATPARAAARLAFLPLRDVLGLGVWALAFAGSHVRWRGRRYRLDAGGVIRVEGAISGAGGGGGAGGGAAGVGDPLTEPGPGRYDIADRKERVVETAARRGP